MIGVDSVPVKACSHFPKGDLPKAACGVGWHLPLAARVFISRREDARGGGGGSSWQGGSRKVGDGVMTQDERRNPSRHRIEEHDMLNWKAAGPVMPGPRCLISKVLYKLVGNVMSSFIA